MQVPPPSHRKPRRRFHSALILTLVALGVAAFLLLRRVPPPPCPSISVGPDTTLFTGPLDSNGMVDYVAALNQKNSQNITPNTNAFVALLPVFGTTAKVLGPAHAQIVHLAGGDESPGCWTPLPTDPKASRADSDRQYANYHSAQTRPWKQADQKDHDAWLDSNQQALALLSKAAERQKFWIPLARPKPDSSLVEAFVSGEFYFDLGDAAAALRVRAMRSLGQGQPEQAWSDLRTAHRLADLLASDTSIIGILRGRSILDDTLSADVSLLGAAHADQNLLADMHKTLLALHPVPRVPEVFRRDDRYEPLDAIEQMAVSVQRVWEGKFAGKNIPYYQKLTARNLAFPDWNLVLRTTNTFLDNLYSDAPADPADRAKHQKTLSDLETQITDALRKDEPLKGDVFAYPRWGESSDTYSRRIAMHVLGLFMPALSRPDEILATTRQRLSLIVLASAIQLYHAGKAAYPSDLSVLVPSYLPAIPTDPDGTPIRFATTADGFTLQSAGPYADDPELLKSHKKSTIDIVIHNP